MWESPWLESVAQLSYFEIKLNLDDKLAFFWKEAVTKRMINHKSEMRRMSTIPLPEGIYCILVIKLSLLE